MDGGESLFPILAAAHAEAGEFEEAVRVAELGLPAQVRGLKRGSRASVELLSRREALPRGRHRRLESVMRLNKIGFFLLLQ